ncbi:hypothetical protein PP724_22850 [Ralstonia solanacearum]|uniref:hypothetical protein n=1 Tax=Ralstonia solanacearum TaxID=305 RepID=UPI001FFA9DEA|nr:hypothetical protein [Ralstonia solanacearum]MDC6237006.1 hypothetical protein [Ralstonia solanacearum]MDD7810561.1 hypothetical protein [Ralstonia solanacearum]
MEDWKRLVTPGHTWVARMNAFTWIGVLVMALFGLSLVRDVYSNTYGLAQKLAQVNTAPPTWWEMFKASPWQTLTGRTADLFRKEKPPRPVLDYAVASSIVNPVPATPIPAEKLTSVPDLQAYIEDVTKALNDTGKLKDPCEPLADLRKPWVNKSGTPDTPLCLTSATGDTIWMASIINTSNNAMWPLATPWLGLFHRVDGKWKYFNVERLIGARVAALPAYPNVNFDMIPYQVAKDFPYLIAQPKKAGA